MGIGILDPARYPAASAVVRAQIGDLLSDATWRDLISVSSLEAMRQRLLETSYGSTLESEEGVETSLEWLERALLAHMARRSRAPITFLPRKTKVLVDWFWRRFEVDNVKTVLRTVRHSAKVGEARRSLIPLGEASTFQWEDLVSEGSVSALIERIGDTFYGRALKQAVDQYRKSGQLFVLEVALDRAYFRQLLRLLDRARGWDRRWAEQFIGTLIDGQNILWAFRYRIHYNLSPEEIINYAIPSGVRVHSEILQAIATGASVASIMEAIWSTKMPDLDRLEDLSDEEALREAEKLFDRYFQKKAEEATHGLGLHLGFIIAYQILQEGETRDLITVAESKAMGWTPEDLRTYLHRFRGEAS